MSLILDALRKMEQDRNSRRGAAQNIRPEVLRYRGKAQPHGKIPYLGLGIGAALLVCGIGAGFLLKGNHHAVKVAEPAPLGSVPSSQPIVESAAAPVAAAPPAAAAGVVPAAAAPGTAPVLQPVAQQLARPATSQLPLPAPGPAAAPRRIRQVEAAAPARPDPAQPAQQKPLRRDASSLSPAPADIAISGIAWQEERTLRRAVVNGSLVGEGAEVSGARVTEIRDDRVRFSRGGQLFEILLSSSFSSR